MEKELSLIKIRNPFNARDGREVLPLPCYDETTIADLFEVANISMQDFSAYTVLLNGRICQNFNKQLFPGDIIAIVPKLQTGGLGGGDGGKNVGATLAMIAVMVTATVISGGLVAAGYSAVTGALAGGLTMAGGALAVNSFLPSAAASMPVPQISAGAGPSSGLESSPTYGFTGARNSWEPGLPYPVLYGKYMTASQVINHWVETNNAEDHQTVKMLIVMSEGICKTPVESADDIWVDNRIRLSDIRDYDFETTKGGLDQDAISISGFDQVHQYQPISAKIEDPEVLVLDGDAFAFVDTSPLAQTVTNTGVIQDVVTKKFGAGSMHFDHVGDELSVPHGDANNFENSDFTVKFFYYPILWGTNQIVWGKRGAATGWFALWLTAANRMEFGYASGGAYNQIVYTGVLTNGAWNHIELCKKGDWYHIFLGGGLQQSKERMHNVFHLAHPMVFGTTLAWSAMNGCNAYIDDAVVIKGKVLHTTSFDVPTEACSTDWGFIVETKGKADRLIPHVEWPGGIYEVDNTGKLIDRDCDLTVKYQERGAGTWILRQGTFAFTSGSTEPSVDDEIEGNISGAIGTYVDCEVTVGTWGAGTAAGTMVLKDVTGTFSTSETLNNNTIAANNIATAAAASSDLRHFERITAAQRTPVRREFPIDVTKNSFDVKMTRVSSVDYDTKYVSDFYWIGFDAILDEELKHPGLSLLAISIQASEQLNSITPNITALWDRGTIAVPDWFPKHKDFTDYTKVDPNGRFTAVMDWRIEVTGLTRQEDAYIYKDMGADCFDGDFTCYIEAECSAIDDAGWCAFWSLANLVDDYNGIDTANGDVTMSFLL